MKVIVTGGLVRANSLEAVGPMSEHAFQVINVGTAVLGADGMSAEVGPTTFDEAEARTAMAMAANAQQVIVAVDGSKIGKVTLAKMVTLNEIDHLVTDSTADPAQLERIGASGSTSMWSRWVTPESVRLSVDGRDQRGHRHGDRLACGREIAARIVDVRVGGQIVAHRGREPDVEQRAHIDLGDSRLDGPAEFAVGDA